MEAGIMGRTAMSRAALQGPRTDRIPANISELAGKILQVQLGRFSCAMTFIIISGTKTNRSLAGSNSSKSHDKELIICHPVR
jgi:hypothetical protein